MGCGSSSNYPTNDIEAAKPDVVTSAVSEVMEKVSEAKSTPDLKSLEKMAIAMDLLTKSNKEAATKLIQKTFRGMIGRNRAKRNRLWHAWNALEYKEENEQAESFALYQMLKKAFLARTVGKENDDICEKHDNDDDDASLDIKLIDAMTAIRSQHQLARAVHAKNILNSATKDKENIIYSELSLAPNDIVSLSFVMQLSEDLNDGKLMKEILILEMLSRIPTLFSSLPNIVPFTFNNDTNIRLTVVGDIHGQLRDLLTIFKLNGLPSETNRYLFNGDIVDRGQCSVECIMLVLAFKLCIPDAIMINRGNHEAEDMATRHGFEKECLMKYSFKVFNSFINVFQTLPIAHIIQNTIFIVHGGLPAKNNITLDDINKIDRKVRSLKPYSLMEDLLWADPKEMLGREESTRGAGCLFGSDVCNMFCKQNSLSLVVRSHECVDKGYECWFNDQLITIFSASNYCNVTDNIGAFMVFNYTLSPTIVTFSAFDQHKLRTSVFRKPSETMEQEILSKIIARIAKHRFELMKWFVSLHTDDDHTITRAEWSTGLQIVLKLKLPFLLFQHQLGLPILGTDLKPKGPIDFVEFLSHYDNVRFEFVRQVSLLGDNDNSNDNDELGKMKATFERQQSTQTKSVIALIDLLYRFKDEIGALFRFFDTDGNGTVTVSEFCNAVHVLLSVLDKDMRIQVTDDEISQFALSLDKNEDGGVGYEEFFSLFDCLDGAYTSTVKNELDTERKLSEIIESTIQRDKKQLSSSGGSNKKKIELTLDIEPLEKFTVHRKEFIEETEEKTGDDDNNNKD